MKRTLFLSKWLNLILIAVMSVCGFCQGSVFAQMPMPVEVPHYFGPYPNYANSPMPKGSITSITLTDGGSDYVAPVVDISDAYGTGTGATATAAITAGVVTSITLTNGGSGYTAPIITIADTAGTGAFATASIGGAPGSLSGGIRKFINSLPKLGEAGINNLGQYIPTGIADTTSYPATATAPASDYYEIALVQYKEKMHTDLPATLLRGYVQLETAANAGVSKHIALTNPDGSPILKANGTQAYGVDIPHYLGPIIVATKDKPVRIKFSNLLPIGAGGDLFLPVDTTVMGAGMGPLDMPGMPGMKEMYTQNRATLHLHGGLVPWISDGTPHQWTTPAGENTQYPKGVSVRNVPDMPEPGDGSLTFYYNNQQSARLMFYHDHAYGITRLNVYAGEAAGYVITDQTEQDLINGTNNSGTNPGLQQLLPDIGIPLVIQDRTFVDADTIMMQDPNWRWGSMPGMPMTGDLWVPSVYVPAQNPYDLSGTNAFGRWQYGPWFWPPTTNISHPPMDNPYYQPDPALPNYAPWEPPKVPDMPNPSMGMEAFMDTPLVNGTVYPYIEVEPRAYRFRILNAADDRFFNLHMYVADATITTSDGRTNTEVKMVPAVRTAGFPSTWSTDGREGGVPDPATAGPSWIQIGNEGGFLPAPVVIPNQPINWNTNATAFNFGNVTDHSLLIGCAERADVIVDFSQYPGQTIILYNDAPAAFPALDPRYDYYTGNPDQIDAGGTPSTQPGFGPNTRTVMQIRVANTTPAPAYDLNALKTAFNKTPDKRGVFEASQDQIIVPQAPYNNTYNATFPGNWTAYAQIFDTSKTFTPIGTTSPVTIQFQPKAIQDEMGEAYDTEYGRMSGMLGLERPNTVSGNQNFMLYGYASPPVDIMSDSMTPIGTLDDGTQMWKITHNGVDTHPIHFHLFNVQLINRVAWDGALLPPEPNELGWKETVRVNPLEDTIVAMRPIAPTQHFDIPNSVRLIDPTMPYGAVLMGPPGGFLDPDATPVSVINHEINYGWEYVWHCHILSHEEMDMMHSMSFAVAPKAPSSLAATPFSSPQRIDLTWIDNSLSETGFTIERATDSAFTTGLTTFTVGPDVITYSDDTVSNFQTYYYRVRATNTVGDTTIYPAPSVGFPTKTMNSAWSDAASILVTSDLIVDNADGPGSVSIAGSWTASTASAGYQGTNYLHDGNVGKGTKSVTFTPNLPSNGMYQVYIRYTAFSNRATAVPIDIVSFDGTNTATVNQRINGGQWVNIGSYAFSAGNSGYVRIRTTGTTDGYVIADAVRFVQLSNTLPVIVDNASGPASVTISGAWTASTATTGYFGTNYLHDGNVSKGTKSVTFTPSLPSAGQYQVYVRYTADPNRATVVPVDITSTTGTSTVNVNQRINGSQWFSLGTYTFSAGTSGNVRIRTTGTTDGYVIADAVRFVQVSAIAPVFVDNTDGPTSVSIVGAWTTSTIAPGFWGTNYLHDGNAGKGTKSVTFTPNLLSGGQYQVYIRYTADPNRATAVPVDVVSNAGTSTVNVNQRLNNNQWVSLGTYAFNTGTAGSVQIRTTGTTDGYVIADAVQFVYVGP